MMEKKTGHQRRPLRGRCGFCACKRSAPTSESAQQVHARERAKPSEGWGPIRASGPRSQARSGTVDGVGPHPGVRVPRSQVGPPLSGWKEARCSSLSRLAPVLARRSYLSREAGAHPGTIPAASRDALRRLGAGRRRGLGHRRLQRLGPARHPLVLRGERPVEAFVPRAGAGRSTSTTSSRAGTAPGGRPDPMPSAASPAAGRLHRRDLEHCLGDEEWMRRRGERACSRAIRSPDPPRVPGGAACRPTGTWRRAVPDPADALTHVEPPIMEHPRTMPRVPRRPLSSRRPCAPWLAGDLMFLVDHSTSTASASS